MTDAHIYVIGILLAWMAGIRAYLTVFGVGLAGLMGWVDLPPALAPTQSWWVLGTSGALALAEFFADKIPGVDSVWDLLHTLLRVPAGAFLAAATLAIGCAAACAGASLGARHRDERIEVARGLVEDQVAVAVALPGAHESEVSGDALLEDEGAFFAAESEGPRLLGR